MKIAITADPFLPVPPQFYGGIERVIDLLIKELVQNGHDVTLFAHKESQVGCALAPYKQREGIKGDLQNSYTITKGLLLEKFDVVHSFARMAYLLPMLRSRLPKLMSYQREPTIGQIKRAILLSKNGTLAFTGCSNYISDQIAPYAPSQTVYNCIDIDKYSFTDTVTADAPIVFLGRIEPIKGTHTAIDIAMKTKKKLVIAGNVAPAHREYFNKQVKPFIGDQISYIGPVNDQQKNTLLGNAQALLMPIHWNEPFGIVMIEAMACGTPVIGFERGAVPEVVCHGETGFTGNTSPELENFVNSVSSINRRRVREHTEQMFSSDIIAREYVRVYEKLVNHRFA